MPSSVSKGKKCNPFPTTSGQKTPSNYHNMNMLQAIYVVGYVDYYVVMVL